MKSKIFAAPEDDDLKQRLFALLIRHYADSMGLFFGELAPEDFVRIQKLACVLGNAAIAISETTEPLSDSQIETLTNNYNRFLECELNPLLERSTP